MRPGSRIKAGVITGVSIGHRILEGGVEYLTVRRAPHHQNRNLRAVARHDSRERARDDPHGQIAGDAAHGEARYEADDRRTHPEPGEQAGGAGRADDRDHGNRRRRRRDARDRAGDRARRPDDAGQEHRRRPRALARAGDGCSIATATAVPAMSTARTTTAFPVISVRPNVPLGTAFVRAACAKLVCNGNVRDAAEYAQPLGRFDAGSRAVAQGRGRARHDDRCDLGGRSSIRTSPTTFSSCCGRRRSSARFPACATCRSTRRCRADRRRHVRVGRGGEAEAGHQAGVQRRRRWASTKVGRDHRADRRSWSSSRIPSAEDAGPRAT